MAGDIDLSKYEGLLAKAKQAFRVDSAYAIAVAKPAGAVVARRQQKEAVLSGDSKDSDV